MYFAGTDAPKIQISEKIPIVLFYIKYNFRKQKYPPIVASESYASPMPNILFMACVIDVGSPTSEVVPRMRSHSHENVKMTSDGT